MNLLVDFLTARYRHGSGEYHRRVVITLLQRISRERFDVNIFALYDSSIQIAFEDIRPEHLCMQYNIKFLDIQKKSINAFIEEFHIDRFFVACAQRMGEISGFLEVSCPIVCVTHDLGCEEMFFNSVHEYLSLPRPIERIGIQATRYWRVRQSFIQFLREFKYWITRLPLSIEDRNLPIMRSVIQKLQSNPESVNVVVSNYTKSSMMYNFGIPADRIKIYYSPERIEVPMRPIENLKLKKLIDQGKRYLLLLSADRPHKNPRKAIAAFHKYSRFHPDIYLVTTGYRVSTCANHIDLEFLSDSDLNQALSHCYALIYPSFFEGFGYPPLEAMKYGKPVLSSNSTSLPEVLGDSAIYFSPLYETAIFEALMKLSDSNYSIYSQKSRSRYQYMKTLQEADLEKLVSVILND